MDDSMTFWQSLRRLSSQWMTSGRTLANSRSMHTSCGRLSSEMATRMQKSSTDISSMSKCLNNEGREFVCSSLENGIPRIGYISLFPSV